MSKPAVTVAPQSAGMVAVVKAAQSQLDLLKRNNEVKQVAVPKPPKPVKAFVRVELLPVFIEGWASISDDGSISFESDSGVELLNQVAVNVGLASPQTDGLVVALDALAIKEIVFK